MELLVTQLSADDPTFFDRFGVEMQSGDHLRVEAAMADAEARVKKAFSTLDVGASQGPTADNRCLVIVVVVLAFWFWVIPLEPTGDGRLGHAEMVGRVATTFAR